jgi:hypothetical protein
MRILVEDSAEPVSTAYGQARDSLWISDRIRDGTQWGGLGEGLVGSVPVAEAFVLAQGVQEMAFVPEQTAVEKLAAARPHPPFHDRVPPRHPDTGEHGLDAGLGQDLLHERREFPSRSRIREQARQPAS